MYTFMSAVLVTIVLGGSLVAAVVACSVWMIRGGAHRRSQLHASPALHRAAPAQMGLSPLVALARLTAGSTGRRVDAARRPRQTANTDARNAPPARNEHPSVPSFLRAFPQGPNTP